MTTVILVLHFMLAVALVCVILVQRSEGGGLGIGGGGMGGLMTGRGTADLLTRTTAVLAACFMATSLLLAYFAGGTEEPTSILDNLETVPIEKPAPESEVPSVPLDQ